MVTVAAPTDFLRLSDLDEYEVGFLLDLAALMKRRPNGWPERLRGATVAMFFEKPSIRTPASFAAAAHRLGLLPLLLRPHELQLGRGEPVEDTARVLSVYCAGIVVRTFAQETLERMAAAATVPVINVLSDDHHPCQALADLLTLRERLGSLEGVRLAYVGDGNNVATSLVEAGALTGMDVVVATPEGYEPRVSGAVVTHDPEEAVEGADAVYTDVWVSMGEDAERQDWLRALAPFQVNERLMARAKPGAVFMHCLPAHRGEEVTAEVIDGPASVVWDQAANGLPTEQALLYALLSRCWQAP